MIKLNEHFSPITLVIVALVIASLPFICKAYHIDDPLFIWSAKQILTDPTDFFGFNVNWYGQEVPGYIVIKNPPLASYYMAAVAYLFGWGERPLHCGFLIPALVLVWGTYRLARYFCSSPLLAASLAAFTPLFMVSSTTVMSDVMMISMWVWALVFWIRGTLRNENITIYLASFTAVMCALTKYSGIFLFPLFFIFSLSHKRKPGAWLLPLFAGAVLLWGYDEATRALYGVGLLSDAVYYSSMVKNSLSKNGLDNLIIGLSFLGGCLLSPALLSPFLWKKPTIAAWVGVAILMALLLPLLKSLGDHLLIDADGVKWGLAIHLGLFVTIGISVITLVIHDFRNNRDEYGLILFAWIIIIFAFGAFMNWTINARSFLPLAPAAGILLVRRIERLSNPLSRGQNDASEIAESETVGGNRAITTFNHCECFSSRCGRAPYPVRWMGLLLTTTFLVAVLVTWADFRLANTARDAAEQIMNRYAGYGGTVWFQGHWGFQYYMEKEGAKALNLRTPNVRAGDIIVIPSNNTNVYALNPMEINLIETLSLTPSSWIATMSPHLGAGFYWDAKGPLPFALGCVPPEEYGVYQFHGQAGS